MNNINLFEIFENGVKVNLNNGTSKYILFNNYSGKIISRGKIDSLLQLDHTGVYIGIESDGTEWVVHNHHLNKKPRLDQFLKFSSGKKVEEYKKITPTNLPIRVIEESLKAVAEGKNYEIMNNCQHLVSKAATGKSFSPDFQKVSLTVGVAGAVTAALSSKNKIVRGIGIFAFFAGIGMAIYDANRKE